MRVNRGHFTRNDPEFVKSKLGKTEAKTNKGWIKIAHGKVFRGTSRDEVREKAREVAA